MPVLSSEKPHFLSCFWLCDIRGALPVARAIGLFRLAAGLALDLLAKLFNPEQLTLGGHSVW
jgi:hypothetical protein